MQTQQTRREIIDHQLTHWNEFWIRAEDWAESVADRSEELAQKSWRWMKARPVALRWTIALLGVVISTIIGLGLGADVTASSQLMLFLPAVLVAALYSGMYFGAVASLLGAIATIEWKMNPISGNLGPDIVGLVLYFMACTILIGLSRAQDRQRSQILTFADTLEDKIQARTADLQEANQELSDFCYSISHDLRAPMRNIVGSSRILLEEAGDKLDADSKTRLYRLATSANKLATWVDDLLNHARIGHASLKPEWIDLTKMVDDICSQLQQESWSFSSMKVLIQPNMVTTGDRVLVRLALRSLLENCCKYAKKGDRLIIEFGETHVGKRSFLFIQDNGIGFEQKYAAKIFEPFQRLHREEEYSGSGIGLANVHRIVERHEGEIFVTSKPNLGTKFVFRFGAGKVPSDVNE